MDITSLNQNGAAGADIYPAGNRCLYTPARTAAASAVVYPDIYYKLQVHELAACDRMDAYGSFVPSKEFIETMSDGIYDDVVRLHPDVAEYAREHEASAARPEAREAIAFGYGYGPRAGSDGYDGPTGPRGLLRDIIDILLLSEYYRRRRRPYYY